MIIEGRVAEILEPRTGTRQDGTGWTALPFIVEYFEHETDMTPQSIILETLKEEVVNNIKEDMTVRCVVSLKAEHWERDGREGWSQRNRLHQIKCVALPKRRESFMPQENQYKASADNLAAQHDTTPAAVNVPTAEHNEEPDDLPF